MKLTAYQVRCLHLSKELRGTGYSIKRVVFASWKAYLFLFALAALANMMALWAGVPEAAWALDGMIVGVVLRDIRMFRTQARLWPMNVEITDWEKVDALIAENSGASASTGTQPK